MGRKNRPRVPPVSHHDRKYLGEVCTKVYELTEAGLGKGDTAVPPCPMLDKEPRTVIQK